MCPYPAPAIYNESLPIEMGIPFTPRSPRPRIREPYKFNEHKVTEISLRRRRTVGDNANTGFIEVRPVADDY